MENNNQNAELPIVRLKQGRPARYDLPRVGQLASERAGISVEIVSRLDAEVLIAPSYAWSDATGKLTIIIGKGLEA